MCLFRPIVIVRPSKQGHVLVTESHVEEQFSQVLLRRDGLGEHHRLAAATAVATEVEDHANRVLEGARLCVVRKGSSTSHEVLDQRQLSRDSTLVGRRGLLFTCLLDVLVVLQIPEVICRYGSAFPRLEATKPCGHVLEACSERGNRRSHAPMKANQQQAPLTAGERVERRLQQILGHVVVERPLVVAHLVQVQAAPSLGERTVEKLLRLTPEGSLEDEAETTLQFVLLTRDERPVVVGTEHLPERRDVPEQGAGRLDVLHEAPELRQRILHWRRGEQEGR